MVKSMSPRKLIFRVVTALSAMLLYTNEKTSAWLAASFLAVNALIRGFFAGISLWLMKKLDPETMDEYERSQKLAQVLFSAPSETTVQNTELKLLAAGYKIRNHAANAEDWTDDHSRALEAIGDALLNECGWPEPKVHEKLKEIVESIDGLEYG